MVLLIALGVVVFAGVIYMAISKKSNFKVRIVALAALALMVLAVIISIFVIFGVAVTDPGTGVPLDIPPTDIPTAPATNNSVMLLFIIFLLAMFLFVLILSLREQRHKEKAAKNEAER